jgi:hypothetical protein
VGAVYLGVMDLTPYHAKYVAHELTRRCASDSIKKLTAVLSDAQVDLNPHQIEAALFAFRNPLSRGTRPGTQETKRSARMAPNLPEKLELQRKLRGLETKRDEAWRAYDTASRDIDRQKDALLDEISRRLEQKTECGTLFTLRWRVA